MVISNSIERFRKVITLCIEMSQNVEERFLMYVIEIALFTQRNLEIMVVFPQHAGFYYNYCFLLMEFPVFDNNSTK